MKETRIDIISDDNFLIYGLYNLFFGKTLSESVSSVIIIDIDRINNFATLEHYILQASSSAMFVGISRNGLMSRSLDKIPSISISAPITQIIKHISRRPLTPTSQSFWLTQCRALRSGRSLSCIQNDVLSGLKYNMDVYRISRNIGINPKTCYTYIRLMNQALNLKNITELRYLATLL